MTKNIILEKNIDNELRLKLKLAITYFKNN